MSGPITKQNGTHYPEGGTIPCSIRLMLSQLTCQDRWKAVSSLSTILAVDYVLKDYQSKMCSELFVFCCYMLHQLIHLKWVHRILSSVDCGKLNCHAHCLLLFLDCKRKLLELHNFSDWSFTGVFGFTNATSFTGQFTAFVDRHFCWHFPTKLHTKSPLYCNH